ncbi:MAG: ATP-binding cassette domain-containing protein, partial [Acidimicrobiales bacterium]|nr:ATP-binding cassette domain-containing protein [Acidimicrobiales bacterium]
GEVIGIVGSNGAGKTTLLDCISGFQPALHGEVRLRGRPITKRSVSARARAGVGRTFQSAELFGAMSMRENLLVATEPRSWTCMLRDLVWPRRSTLDPAHLDLIEELGFTDVLESRPADLSFGARRVAGVLRAVLRRPAVLLLDEPAAGLTPAQAEAMMEVVLRSARQAGIGVLLVEHDHALVLQSCDRVVVLDAGRVLADVPPGEVRRIGAEIDLARLSTSEMATSALPQDHFEAESVRSGPTIPAVVGGSRAAPIGSEPVLNIADLSGGHQGSAIFEGIDLEVRRGEVVSLVGANGSGKSTLLETIAGLLPPLHGSVTIEGVRPDASFDRRVRGGLAYLGEQRPLTRSLSTRDNLLLGGGSVPQALEVFPELEPLLARRAGDLSGGEQHMVVLGRALAAAPSLVVIDELSLGLSPVIVARLTNRLREAADRGAGVLCVEQNVDHAIRLGDRVSVLRGGRLVLDQPIEWSERSRVVAAVGGD